MSYISLIIAAAILTFVAVKVIKLMTEGSKKVKARKARKERQANKERYENFRQRMNTTDSQAEMNTAPSSDKITSIEQEDVPESKPSKSETSYEQVAIKNEQVERDLTQIFEEHGRYKYFSVVTYKNSDTYELMFHNRINIEAPSHEAGQDAMLAYNKWLNLDTCRVHLFNLEDLPENSELKKLLNSSYNSGILARENPLGTYISNKYNCRMIQANIYENPLYDNRTRS